MKKNKIIVPMVALAMMASMGLVSYVDASTANPVVPSSRLRHGKYQFGRGVTGTVSLVSGPQITIKSKDGTTYTVDATNSKVMKGSDTVAPTLVSVSDIAVGDTIMVQGQVNGTTIVASNIFDGKRPNISKPIMVGTISSLQNNSLVILGKDGVSYTVDIANAKLTKDKNVSITQSGLSVGDTVMVQGTLSGTTITATHVFDGKFLHQGGRGQGIEGTVSGVTGTTLTVTGKNGTTYTVDGSSSSVLKGSPYTTSSLSQIKTGDTVMVSGAINGTAVVAQKIFVGQLKR